MQGQRRPLTADPAFFTIIDAEARLLGCSSNALLRVAALEFVARNHETRIPPLFKEERELQVYIDQVRRANELFVGDSILAELSATAPEDLRLAVSEAIAALLERERNQIFHRFPVKSKT